MSLERSFRSSSNPESAGSFTSDIYTSETHWKLNDDSLFNGNDIIGHASSERPWRCKVLSSRTCLIASCLASLFFFFRHDLLRHARDFSSGLNNVLTRSFLLLSFLLHDGIALKVPVSRSKGRDDRRCWGNYECESSSTFLSCDINDGVMTASDRYVGHREPSLSLPSLPYRVKRGNWQCQPLHPFASLLLLCYRRCRRLHFPRFSGWHCFTCIARPLREMYYSSSNVSYLAEGKVDVCFVKLVD